MENQCAGCGAHLELPWKFCPHCGRTQAVAETVLEHEHLAPEKAPAKGAFSGLLLGLIAAPILVIVGAMLCLTGLGAILGIPMVIAGIAAPLVGPMVGLESLKGQCPWCGVSVSSVANTKDFDCHECGKRIAIRHQEFVVAN